jgi:hypothetical protein
MDLVPSPDKDLGSIREAVLELPSFMDTQWIAKNIHLSPAAVNAINLYSDEIREETGAPIHRSETRHSPAEFEAFLRYPLFLRSIASRAACADPVGMNSLFSIIAHPVLRFSKGMTANARASGNTTSPTALCSAILEAGSDEEIEALVQMAALSALLAPLPGLQGLVSRHPAAFADVARFIEDIGLWLSPADRQLRKEHRPSWEHFRDFHYFNPTRSHGEPWRIRVPGAAEDAERVGIHGWLPREPWVLKAFNAISGEVALDAGMTSPGEFKTGEDLADFVRSGSEFPLFFVSMATRLSLLHPAEVPSFHMALPGASVPFFGLMREKGWDDGQSLNRSAMRAYPESSEDERRVIANWMIMSALVIPDMEILAHIRALPEVSSLMGEHLLKVAEKRMESHPVKYEGPDFGRMEAPSGNQEAGAFLKPRMN